MVRATLEFTLPEESDEHLTAVHAGTYRAACHAVEQWIRSKRKYGTPTKAEAALLEELHAMLMDELDGVEL